MAIPPSAPASSHSWSSSPLRRRPSPSRRTMPRAFELERRGNYAGGGRRLSAACSRRAPGDVAALLGLERVLLPLNRSADILPEARAALATDPTSAALYGVALRAWAAADQPDSMRAVAERWARLVAGRRGALPRVGRGRPRGRDRREAALEAYRQGRERLGRPDALAAEMAQLAIADGDYATAAREWVPASGGSPGIASRPWPRWATRPPSSGTRSCASWRPSRISPPGGSRRSSGCDGAIRSADSRRCERGLRTVARAGSGGLARARRSVAHAAIPRCAAGPGAGAGVDRRSAARGAGLARPAGSGAGLLRRRRSRRRAPDAGWIGRRPRDAERGLLGSGRRAGHGADRRG